MKEIYFDEDQLNNLQQIGQALFADAGNPCSCGYHRTLERPAISWWCILANCAGSVAVAAALGIFLTGQGVPGLPALLISLSGLGLWILLRLKRILICLVRIYQRYAPDSVRRKCRFEPSCSQYMILALEKYGVARGLFKGIDRLRRCNIENGGYDYP